MTNPIITVPSNEFLTVNETIEVVRGDYSQFVSGSLSVDEFVKDNYLSYYALINVWCNLALDIGGYAIASLLSMRIKIAGLASTIAVAANYAEFLITKLSSESAAFDYQLPLDSFLKEAEALTFRSARQICVFPKRFAPVVKPKYSKLANASIEKTIAVNTQLAEEVIPRLDSLMQWRGGSRSQMFTHKMVLVFARRIIREILNQEPKLGEKIFPRFGPGSSRNCTNSIYHKYEYLVRTGGYEPSHQIFLLPYLEHPDFCQVVRRTKQGKKVKGNLDRPSLGGKGRFPQVTAMSTVPKSYKANRVIAKEDPCNMSQQLQLFDQMLTLMERSRFGRYMPVRHQEYNQELAREGALTGNIATLDLSHASDSVSKRLVQMLYPDNWYNAFMRCIPTGYILSEHDQGPRRLHIFATMGCGCTFSVETLTFYPLQLACYLVACVKAGLLTYADICKGDFIVPRTISSMGDDCACPTKLAKFIIRELTYFGFSVNTEKSFWSGPFRESCGAEYLKTAPDSVEDVTCLYWPRIPIRWNESQQKQTVTKWNKGKVEVEPAFNRLIALQHQLFSFDHANQFLTEFVRSRAPYTSVTPYGTPRDTLWSEKPNVIKAYYVESVVSPRVSLQEPVVPKRYRRLPSGICIPDGYVLIEYLNEFCKDTGRGLQYLTCRYREFIIEFGVGAAMPTDTEYYSQLMENLRLELTFNRRNTPNGFPLVFNGFRPDNERTLAQVLGLGSTSISVAECYGKQEVKLKVSLL